jgi:hypothetical protein
MSVIKVVQHLPTVDTTDTTDTQSTAFIVKSGVIRFTSDTAKGSCVIETGGNPVATGSSLWLQEGSELIVKVCPVKRADIVSITTGAITTTLNMRLDVGRPAHSFVVGDYVSLIGSSVTSYNTGISHLAVTAVTDTSISVALDSSGYADFTGSATLCNSMKYATLASAGGSKVYATEVQIVGG